MQKLIELQAKITALEQSLAKNDILRLKQSESRATLTRLTEVTAEDRRDFLRQTLNLIESFPIMKDFLIYSSVTEALAEERKQGLSESKTIASAEAEVVVDTLATLQL